MINAVAVITARSGSVRLQNKNILPIGNMNITERAIVHGLNSCFKTIVTSDIDSVLDFAKAKGAIAIKRPDTLTDGNGKHYEAINHAIREAAKQDAGVLGKPVVLLQPTSPFRNGNIIQKCFNKHLENPSRACLSGRDIHYVDMEGNGFGGQVWDGCVAVYPPDKIEKPVNPICVENLHGNMLQIDTEQDYIAACVQEWIYGGCLMPIGALERIKCVELLKPIFDGQIVTVIGRPDGKPISQSRPTVYVNHCVGYDGGRADVVVIVASLNLKRMGINDEIRNACKLAKVVVIRDFGESEWVLENIDIKEKVIVIKETKLPITTGTFASLLVHLSGGSSERVGFQRGVSRINYLSSCYPIPWVSNELALLNISGTDRR